MVQSVQWYSLSAVVVQCSGTVQWYSAVVQCSGTVSAVVGYSSSAVVQCSGTVSAVRPY